MAYTTINKGSLYYNGQLYTGTGASLSVTGVGFQPDFVWIKNRTNISSHSLYDAVRGVQKQIESDNSAGETTETQGLTAFGADGFTVGTLVQVNENTSNFNSFNWKANGAGSSNTAGTISSTVSVNNTSKFSIVTYSGNGIAGATIGHGLGVVPRMIMIKNRSAADGWRVYHGALSSPQTKYLILDTEGDEVVSSTVWNDTMPTSTLFTVGTASQVNNVSGTFVAYCFAEVKGFSKFGKYTGNGSTNGPFIYTGFRPSFVVIKRATGGTGPWLMFEENVNPFNLAIKYYEAESGQAEATGDTASRVIDILSNGFKIRSTGSVINTSGSVYIYMAFAENPFVTSTGIPVTAR